MAGFYRFFKRFSVSIFGGLYDRSASSFAPLRNSLSVTGADMPLKTWVSMSFMGSAATFVASIIAVAIVLALLQPVIAMSFMLVVVVPVVAAALAFALMYMYPIQRASSMKNSIETDLPFALAQMNAIVSSGIPPEFMFDMLTDFDEYGAISGQAKMIVRNIRTFGMSSVNAISDVASRTPSEAFRQVLNGMTTTIEKGGNMVEFINQMSDKAMFDYRIRREKYLKTLSTYADIYTALLVAAPLMMLSVLGIMSLIGGSVMGMTIDELITMMTWLALPGLNMAFIAFVHMTYPGT